MNECAPAVAGARGSSCNPCRGAYRCSLLPGGSLRSPPANFLSPRWGGIRSVFMKSCTKGPSGNKVYILLLAPRPAGKARATSIPAAVCKERATQPAGLRAAARRGAAAGGICGVAAPRRCHHIACVAAPCICPPGARAKMHTLFPDGPLACLLWNAVIRPGGSRGVLQPASRFFLWAAGVLVIRQASGRRVPLVFRYDLGLLRITLVGRRHDLYAVLVENIKDIRVQRRIQLIHGAGFVAVSIDLVCDRKVPKFLF